MSREQAIQLVLQLAECAVDNSLFPDDDFYFEEPWEEAIKMLKHPKKLGDLNKFMREQEDPYRGDDWGGNPFK